MPTTIPFFCITALCPATTTAFVHVVAAHYGILVPRFVYMPASQPDSPPRWIRLWFPSTLVVSLGPSRDPRHTNPKDEVDEDSAHLKMVKWIGFVPREQSVNRMSPASAVHTKIGDADSDGRSRLDSPVGISNHGFSPPAGAFGNLWDASGELQD